MPSFVTNSAKYRTEFPGEVAFLKRFSPSSTQGGTCQDRGEKKRDRLIVERGGNVCGTRLTIIGTFPLTSRNEGHMARREGTIEEISLILETH